VAEGPSGRGTKWQRVRIVRPGMRNLVFQTEDVWHARFWHATEIGTRGQTDQNPILAHYSGDVKELNSGSARIFF
jgi:hypothetical protein